MRCSILFIVLLLAFLSVLQNPYSLQAQHPSILECGFIFEQVPFKECHASTIESTPEGLIVAWFGGSKEGNEDVEIWVSRQINGEWSIPAAVASGIQHKGKRYATWNPVLFLYPDGPLMLFYKVGPNPREWWGKLKTSNDYGKTWSRAYRLPENILGPIKNKPILMDDGRLICPSSTEHSGWKTHFEITSDKGQTWERVGPINPTSKYNIIQPSILTYPNGKLQVLCRSKENYIISSWSNNDGYTWSTPTTLELPNPNSGTDAVSLASGVQMIVYNHSKREKNKWGGPRTPLNLAISKDGNNWKTVITLEDQEGEYSYPAIIESDDNMVHITYTYNRKKIKYIKLDPKKIKF